MGISDFEAFLRVLIGIDRVGNGHPAAYSPNLISKRE
jgi:hypothetical protein